MTDSPLARHARCTTESAFVVQGAANQRLKYQLASLSGRLISSHTFCELRRSRTATGRTGYPLGGAAHITSSWRWDGGTGDPRFQRSGELPRGDDRRVHRRVWPLSATCPGRLRGDGEKRTITG